MSPIIGMFIAIIAGLVAPAPRSVVVIVSRRCWGHGRAGVVPGVAVGVTTRRTSRLVRRPTGSVQALIVTAICGLAAAICWIRMRRSPVTHVLPSGMQRVVLLAIATVAAFAATLGFAFVTDRPKHPGTGSIRSERKPLDLPSPPIVRRLWVCSTRP